MRTTLNKTVLLRSMLLALGLAMAGGAYAQITSPEGGDDGDNTVTPPPIDPPPTGVPVPEVPDPKVPLGDGGGLSETTLITTGAALSLEGDVFVWGFRGSAQQGNGQMTVPSKDNPQKVQSLSNVEKLAGGAYHLLALDANGDVWGWGQNGYGETGCTGAYVTVPCKALGNAVQIATGEYFSVALDQDGKVWTWGHNLYGQLGDGTSKNSNRPVQVNLNGETARLIGGAYEGAFAVTKEGHVWGWGDNEAAGLGLFGKGKPYGVQDVIRTPTRVPNLDFFANDIVHIAGGNGWGEALLSDGRVIGWGMLASLGQGYTTTKEIAYAPIIIMENVSRLYTRYVGSMVLTTNGEIYTWGQTGGSAFPMVYGATVTKRTPVTGEGKAVVKIGGAKENLYYQTEDGAVYGIGYNDLYKLDQRTCCSPWIEWPGIQIKLF